MSARPERYVALPNGEPDPNSFACRFTRYMNSMTLQVRGLVNVALIDRHFDDQSITVILTRVVDWNLVVEERFFSQLGVEWYDRYDGSLELLLHAFGEGDDFLFYPDQREELLRAVHDSFKITEENV